MTKAADKNNYFSTLLATSHVDNGRATYEVLIREYNENEYINVKVAIAGPVDAGKSSFLSVLTSGKLDDGRGSARILIANHTHEVKTGRTSSISQHILGFDARGSEINYSSISGKRSWPEIVRSSAKVVSFFDLCGHEKYLRTTILGLTSSQPDLCLIIVGGNKGVRNDQSATFRERGSRDERKRNFDNMTREHIFLCVSLNIPFAVIVTKIDVIREKGLEDVYANTIKDIQAIIKCPYVRRHPIKVETTDDVLICARQIYTGSVAPIFTISNVTGEGLDQVRTFLNVMKKGQGHSSDGNVEFHVDASWSVPGVGTVVGGHLLKGSIKVNDKLWLGPNGNNYDQVSVRSIHCKRVPLQQVSCGSYVCLALKKVDRSQVRRGTVVVSAQSQHKYVRKFVANVKVMRSHATTIRLGYQPLVHVSSVRQSATLIGIEDKVNSRDLSEVSEDKVLRTGDTATVTFKFCFRPEFVTEGMKVLLVEGKTKVVGVVKKVLE